jgi:hypothetical protein
MAADGTEKVLGGTRYKRYPDPVVKGTPNGYGLYPWSVFKAPICSWNGTDEPVFVGDLQLENAIYLLLFTSDIPCFLELRATDKETDLQFSQGAVNTLSVPFLFTTLGGTTPATISTQGAVIAGYTGGLADVYCTGFPARGRVIAPSQGYATYTDVICVANGPVIASPVSSLSFDFKQEGNNAFAPVPVIINAYTYTAAVRAADNLITAPDGSLFAVVGLWSVS